MFMGIAFCHGIALRGGSAPRQGSFRHERGDSLDTLALTRPQLSAMQLFAKGDSLRRAYSFDAASEAYSAALKCASDSTERLLCEEGLRLAQNGLNMLGFCNKPTVVAKERFALEDFFLYYPLPDRGWRPLPNALDSVATSQVRATWIPEGASSLIYSSADAEGSRNLYHTHFADSVWTAPELFGEHLTSSGNEIFPMLSPDGRNLCFASDGLYGMGGYDLYVSHWNPEHGDWDTPVNMGFPYSSPYDDFLFVNSPDGRYSVFASNRECSADSVYVYVLEYDSMPVRYSIEDDSDEIRALVSLVPPAEGKGIDNTGVAARHDEAESQLHREYMSRAMEVRRLRDSIYVQGMVIDRAREQFASAPEAGRKAIADNILGMEQLLLAMEDSLGVAVRRLGKLEMDIIASGTVINPDYLQDVADSEVKGADNGYTFSARRMGSVPAMRVLSPVPEFDYSFMVLPEGRFAEDNTLPSGLVYQIQIFSSSKQATPASLKGLSPVFWRRSASLKYTYYAGLFRSYKDVLANLNKVKKAGFRSAFIVAFSDGRQITVSEARKMEKTVVNTYNIRISMAGDGTLSESAKTVLLSVTGKEIARNTDAEGNVSYVIGPYRDRMEAVTAATALRANGFPTAEVEEKK